MASATLPLNRGPCLSWRGGIWNGTFLFAAASSEPTGPFSPPIHFHRPLLSLTKPKYRKENGTGRSSNDSSSFMFGGIRNDFLNGALYALLYCKKSVNEFNVQLLARRVHFSSLIKKLKWFIAAVGVWAVLSCGRLIMILVALICVITNCIYSMVKCMVP